MGADAVGDGWHAAGAAARALAYAGVLLTTGGAVFLAWVHDGRARERRRLHGVVVAAGVTAVVATLAAVPLHAVMLAGTADGAAQPRFLLAALDSATGWSALARLAALAVLLVGVARSLRGGSATSAVGAGSLAVVSFAAEGHSVTADPRWLALLANGCHGLAGAVWFGGLVLLALTLRSRRSGGDAVDGAAMVRRFSACATVALPLVAVAGVCLAWVELRSPAALLTPYGALLLAKAGLVAALAGVGAYNKFRLVPAVQRAAAPSGGAAGPEVAWRRLGVAVRVEATVLLLVLALTAVLVGAAPPRGHDATVWQRPVPAAVGRRGTPA